MATISNYTRQSINGFIASEPRLSFSDEGVARLYLRIGINHFDRREDGGYDQLDPTFHDLIQFGKSAERSADMFLKGDQFIAQGRVREYTRQVEGQDRTDEQFVATRLGHDANATRYTVVRGRDHQRDAAGTEAVIGTEAAGQAPADKPLAPPTSAPPSAAPTTKPAGWPSR